LIVNGVIALRLIGRQPDELILPQNSAASALVVGDLQQKAL
jgi:hypothetical protein